VTRSLVRTFIARRPGRACVLLLAFTVCVGGALYSVTEPDADWFDGVWWATVTLTTVGYGDYSPESFLGRWLAAFVMLGGIGCVAILTGILADEIREAKVEHKDLTPELDDDLDHVIDVLAQELDKLRAKVSHPEVVAALQRVHASTPEEVP
jgi:voltage-gated potassium channel